jgi:hypothetical protein
VEVARAGFLSMLLELAGGTKSDTLNSYNENYLFSETVHHWYNFVLGFVALLRQGHYFFALVSHIILLLDLLYCGCPYEGMAIQRMDAQLDSATVVL